MQAKVGIGNNQHTTAACNEAICDKAVMTLSPNKFKGIYTKNRLMLNFLVLHD